MKKTRNPLFYVSYEPKRTIVRTANMTPAAELAHRRLCDWIWAEGHPPANNRATLAAICRCTNAEWPAIRATLRRNGWIGSARTFYHPEALDVLTQARVAYRFVSQRAANAARARWLARGPRKRPKPARAPASPAPGCSSNAQAMHKHPTPDAKALLKHPAADAKAMLNNDKRITIKESRLKTKESLSVKKAERLTLSSSPPEKSSAEENLFLKDVLQTLADFDPKQASKELVNWGGWWRLRFRDDPGKAWRVLREVGSMIREKRIRTNAGAAAKDLWGRFA